MNLQRNDRFTLVEALDRLIDKGVSVSGDVSISVADIDLVYLGVRVLLCSADEVPYLRSRGSRQQAAHRHGAQQLLPLGDAEPASRAAPEMAEPLPASRGRARDVIDVASGNEAADEGPRRLLDIDPGQIERDLCRLVLTVVELLRQLMEKQAIRRMEGDTLKEEEIERLGLAFARLDEKMEELKEVFGLNDDDLNIDLGPLGTLV